MSILDIFSKRKRRENGGVPDVYVYDHIPGELRVQVIHITQDVIGRSEPYSESEKIYEKVHKALCREFGVFALVDQHRADIDNVFNFVLKEPNVDRVLDAIELIFSEAQRKRVDIHRGYLPEVSMDAGSAIAELNGRFLEHGVGYQFESGRIIRLDSGTIHAEVVKPVLALLRDPKFAGANEEFLSAHEHYRHGRYKECAVEALKAFESTMKAICKKRGWTFKQTDTAKTLIDVCFAQGLVPSYLQSEFSALRSLLESGLPVVRNKQGGHGQGADPIVMPAYVAHYALNLAASNILFLFEADKALK